MSDLDRDPMDMRDDARAWARLNYPAITVGRYADAADQIQRLASQLAAALAKVEEAERDGLRYRWLRARNPVVGNLHVIGEELDFIVDSAMTAKEGG